MRRWAFVLLTAAGFVFLACLAALVFTDLPGDPALYPPRPPEAGIPIFVDDFGYHSGIVVPRAELAEIAAADGLIAVLDTSRRFGAYTYLEIGWGDADLYRRVPTIASLHFGQALRALFAPNNPSVLHVVGIGGNVRDTFPGAAVVAIPISRAGLRRLAARLEGSFAHDAAGLPIDAGPGLYGPSRFYRATGHFSVLNVCNHWVSHLLNEAGLPISPILATLPAGLLLDLSWRSGLSPYGAPPHGS